MNPVNPNFLKRFDKFLLQNHPLVWVTRIHYVLLYAAYVFVLSFLLGWVFPIDLIQPNSLGIYYLLFILISITLYVIWVYRNSIYNIENRFGLRSMWDEFKIFGFYFVTVALLCTTYLPFEAVYQYRMANAIEDEEYVRELNVLNLADPFFVTDSYSYESLDVNSPNDNKTYFDYGDYKNWGHFAPNYYNPYGIFGRDYYDDYPNKHKLILGGTWTDTILKRKFAEVKKDPVVIKSLIADYIRIFNKYGVEWRVSPEQVYQDYLGWVKLGSTTQSPEWNVYGSDESSYNSKNSIESVYRNVGEAKFDKVYYHREGYYIFLWYMVFYVVVFFMMFRNVKWQQFIITIITLAILPLLIFIPITILFRYSHEGNIFCGICLLIYTGVFIYSVTFGISPPKRFTAFGSILLQLSNLLTPLAPLVLLIFSHEVFGAFKYYMPTELVPYDIYYDGMTDNAISTLKNYPEQVKECLYQRLLQDYWRDMYDKCLLGTQIFGMIFYIFAYMPYMKEQFVRLKALPRKS